MASQDSWVKLKFLPREHKALPTSSGLCPVPLSLLLISNGRPVFFPFLKQTRLFQTSAQAGLSSWNALSLSLGSLTTCFSSPLSHNATSLGKPSLTTPTKTAPPAHPVIHPGSYSSLRRSCTQLCAFGVHLLRVRFSYYTLGSMRSGTVIRDLCSHSIYLSACGDLVVFSKHLLNK